LFSFSGALVSPPRGVAAAHHVLVGLAREWKEAAARDGAEHHGTDHRAGLARHGVHVEHMVLAAEGLDHVEQVLCVGAAVTGLHAFRRGEDARRRADDQRAQRRAHAVADLARGLEQFRRDDGVERARHRAQAEHWPPASKLRERHRKHFDVVGGGAGALRHAGYRRALRGIAGVAGNVDQPFGEHAAAFAAEGADEKGDGSVLFHGAAHAG
jgi:hypothetical protein